MIKMLERIACVLPLIASSCLSAQDASAEIEARMVASIEARADTALEFLEELVNVNSGSMNFPGVRKVGDMLRAEFDKLGMTTEWIDGAPFERAGHLVARQRGQGTHLLLIGHLDTVFELDSPFQRFERDGKGNARGPGVVDMKGGDVVIVEALRALREVGILEDLNITVIMTGDEERSGRPLALARKVLYEAAEEADIALAFENGDSDTRTAVIARRGSTGWRLDVAGTPAHSSQVFQPEIGAGAIYETARILNGFYEELAGEALLTFNPGMMLGGTAVDFDAFKETGSASGKTNVVAQLATVTGDLRCISIPQLDATREKMSSITAKSLPGTSAKIVFDEGYPPLAPSDGNLKLLEIFDQVSRDLGFGPVSKVDPRRAGAADVSFTAGLVDMAIDGLGTGGGNDHTVDEWIELSTLALQSKRAAVLIYRLTRT